MKNTFIILLSLIMMLDIDVAISQISSPFSGTEQLEQDVRRRGGFGGRRRSFGGRKKSSNRSKSNSRSRSRSSKPAVKPSKNRPSFGGKRMTPSAAKKKYGTPRKTEKVTSKNAQGVNTNYTVNHYGGYGSGLMMGYMMGSSMWYWSMPFHPAFYYGRPAYVENADGTMGVYPPTFSFSKLLFTLLIIGVVVFIARKMFFSKSSSNSPSSFG